MEIKLKLPYAENYTLPLPKNIKGIKAGDEYIRHSLMQCHPGFSSESLWDYFITKNEGQRKAHVAVIEKDFYVEKRLLEKNCVFYFEQENGKKTKLFSKHKFKRNGERRKVKLLFLLVLLPVLVAVVFGFIKGAETGRHEEEEPEETVIAEAEIRQFGNVFDFMNLCSDIFESQKVFISAAEYTLGREGTVEFWAEGKEPYELIRVFGETEGVKKCTCGEIVYKDGKEVFEIKMVTQAPIDIVPSQDEMQLFELQGKLSDEFEKTGAQMILSSVSQEEGRVTFLMTAERKILKHLNEKINSLFYGNSLYPVKFTESSGSSGGLIQVNIEGVLLENGQQIESPFEEEKLSEIFIREEANVSSSIPEKKGQTAAVTQNKTGNRTYQKIGTVRKDGKVLYYYRTEENKIFISEEEL